MRKGLVLILMVVFVLSITGTVFAGPFADVPANNWAYGALNQLAKAGIIQGYGDETFRGDKVISRYEMAIIVGKAIEHGDKADDANKALINKLTTEFAQELNNIGVRVTNLETKVKDMDNKLGRIAVDGQFRLRGYSIDDEIAGTPSHPAPNASPVKKSWWQFRGMINITGQVDDNSSVFLGFSNRNTMGAASSGVNTTNPEADFALYGVKIKNGNANYTLGRQYVTLGQGLVLSTGFDSSGVDDKFDGLVADFKAGDTKIRAIGGKTTKIMTESAPKWPDTPNTVDQWYGLDVSKTLSDELTLGATYAHKKVDAAGGKALNYKAVNAVYTFSKSFALKGEYLDSGAATQSKGWTYAAVYSWDKDSITARYVHSDKYGVDPCNSTSYGAWAAPASGNNMGDAYDGRYITYNHTINARTTFTLTYMDYTVPYWVGHDREISSTLLWKF